MEPQTFQLDDGVSVVLDASGNGSVQIGPTRAGQSWLVKVAALQVSTNVLEPTAKLYLGTASPPNFLGGSYTGSNDADTELNLPLRRGQRLTCVWSGGDAGARATLSITGEITVE